MARRVLLLLALLSTTFVALSALAPRHARAQDAQVEEARRQFDVGQTLFASGKYVEAAEAFNAAYAAKPFPAFLFNAAVCFEKNKEVPKAIENFERYLRESPRATDKDDVQKRIDALKAELAAGGAPTSGPVLPEAKTKGLVIIDSKPYGATIYLDNKNSQPLGVTPWNGELAGSHKIILESKGYKSTEKEISPSADKGWYYYFELSEERELAWLEVRANVDSAAVYLDRKQGGAIGQTTYLGNLQPRAYKIIVAKPGFVDFTQDLTAVRGQSYSIDAKLEPAKIGFIRIRTGDTSEGATVKVDGKVPDKCPTAPCTFETADGTHTIAISKGGKKTFSKEMLIQRQTESIVSVKLMPMPSRMDAVWQFVLSGAFVGGGVYAITQSNNDTCPVGKSKDDDPNGKGEDICAYTAYGMFALGGATFFTGVYYLFRDKGAPSTGTIEQRDLAFGPGLAPGYAGLEAAVRF